MTGEFKFSHVKNPAIIGDSSHIHSYRIEQGGSENFKLKMDSRLSTDASGIATCLGLQADANVEPEKIIDILQSKISASTLFRPV